jgi:hypothetical protein
MTSRYQPEADGETYLRRLAETALRRTAGADAGEPTRMWDGLRQVRAAAVALASVAAIDEATADSVVAGLESALTARLPSGPSKMPPGERFADAHPWPVPASPQDPYHAVSIGTTVPVTAGGLLGKLHLLTLVRAPAWTGLTWAVRPPPTIAADTRFVTSLLAALRTARATDKAGASYQVRSSGRRSQDNWFGGELYLFPASLPGTGWLDMVIPGAAHLRVPLDRTVVATSPAPTRTYRIAAVPADSAAGFLDAVTERLLSGRAGDHELAELPVMLTALRVVSGMADDAPALARLATVARLLGLRVPQEIAAPTDAGLPEAWVSLLKYRDHADGLVRVAPVARVMAGLDGARCVLAGLSCGERSAALRVLAWGWPQYYRLVHRLDREPFSWHARDDTGRWHTATRIRCVIGIGCSALTVELSPPLDPLASSLEVTLSSPSGRVSATAPLHWQSP